MRSSWHFSLIAVLALSEPCLAQKLVDPKTVAPEYREAAEKRRAEQIKQLECRRKAEAANVLPRDRTAHITRCLEEASNPATAAATRP
ncbi:MAG TPA: hypothetical protein VHQ48_03650 [Bradyrhizobium sp.]|jgi:hypothetical protein|nr:hypothetical protein [Bradyrhizobium sp.]